MVECRIQEPERFRREGRAPSRPIFPLCQTKKENKWDGTEAVPPFAADVTPIFPCLGRERETVTRTPCRASLQKGC
jgi:hypothetical protein